jgi:polysaccharide export outer membrane protein
MMPLVRRALRASVLLPLLALAAAPAACAGPGTYVWYSQVPPDQLATSHEVTISPGDTLSIRVLGHEEMTLTKEKVRSDGRIAVPLIGEVETTGKRPASLRAELEGRLKDYIVSPSVMVNVDESPLMTVALLGEVTKPGVYTFEPSTGLAQALAAGGGITEYASRDRIFVVRQQPRPMRIRFTYDTVRRNEDHAASFPLRAGDVVVVE